MRPLGGIARPDHEVDEVRWASPEEAGRLLTYEHDGDTQTAKLELDSDASGS